MPKEKSVEEVKATNKNKKEAKSSQKYETPESKLNTTQLFILMLILSVAFNCYIQWKKSEKGQSEATVDEIKKLEKELKESNELLELIKKDQIEVEKMVKYYYKKCKLK